MFQLQSFNFPYFGATVLEFISIIYIFLSVCEFLYRKKLENSTTGNIFIHFRECYSPNRAFKNFITPISYNYHFTYVCCNICTIFLEGVFFFIIILLNFISLFNKNSNSVFVFNSIYLSMHENYFSPFSLFTTEKIH